MKIRIDVSIGLVSGKALGRATGDMELSGIPPVGAEISFVFPVNTTSACPAPVLLSALKVESAIFSAEIEGAPSVLLLLESIRLDSMAAVTEVAHYLETGFGFVFESY
jgi:hypothetical protein